MFSLGFAIAILGGGLAAGLAAYGSSVGPRERQRAVRAGPWALASKPATIPPAVFQGRGFPAGLERT